MRRTAFHPRLPERSLNPQPPPPVWYGRRARERGGSDNETQSRRHHRFGRTHHDWRCTRPLLAGERCMSAPPVIRPNESPGVACFRPDHPASICPHPICTDKTPKECAQSQRAFNAQSARRSTEEMLRETTKSSAAQREPVGHQDGHVRQEITDHRSKISLTL